MSYRQAVATSTPAPTKGKLWTGTLWFLQIGMAINFVMAGAIKLIGVDPMVDMFVAIGLGQWFRYFTGGIEVLAGLLLLVPATAGAAAVVLGIVMAGAVVAEVFILSGQGWIPAILFGIVSIVAYGRRESTQKLLKRGSD